ncbi:uncharacterized protein LOC130960481 [Arachis stenosperma]|uniref:uncharacterized protein LOC130960481 n=1 Tax=Arachis stenosperma TaxID=217475 RepID=UPI0025ACA7A5|nr:uncharacterized protein LOC130960481 [Arachis stenosperma]
MKDAIARRSVASLPSLMTPATTEERERESKRKAFIVTRAAAVVFASPFLSWASSSPSVSVEERESLRQRLERCGLSCCCLCRDWSTGATAEGRRWSTRRRCAPYCHCRRSCRQGRHPPGCRSGCGPLYGRRRKSPWLLKPPPGFSSPLPFKVAAGLSPNRFGDRRYFGSSVPSSFIVGLCIDACVTCSEFATASFH